MNKEQQRIAIAEACGWTAEQDSNGYWRAVDPKHGNAVELWLSERSVWSVGIPDYLNDLNAMHEAEKVLTTNQFDEYCYRLDTVGGMRHCAHATAAQRAEAFLRAINKWTTNQNEL
jgi:hypothetical protein